MPISVLTVFCLTKSIVDDLFVTPVFHYHLLIRKSVVKGKWVSGLGIEPVSSVTSTDRDVDHYILLMKFAS